MGFSMTGPPKLLLPTRLFRQSAASFATKPSQRIATIGFYFLAREGRGFACRMGIVGETCFWLGRAVARAKVKQRHKIVNPKKQSLAAAPNLLAASHSFY